MTGVRVDGAGVWRVVGAPSFGAQHVGYAPGGPIDRASMRAGNALLGNAPYDEALEIVFAQRVVFTADATVAVTGASRAARIGDVTLAHATVHEIRAGDVLQLGAPAHGLRTYICIRAGHGCTVGRTLGEFRTWRHPDGLLRVIDGPEFSVLRHPEELVTSTWTTTEEMNDIGMRLDGPRLAADAPEMISAPVADGTIQLTPRGPIILLRNRQTIGGYPRIACVIDVDVDELAHYAPRRAVRFTRVSLEDALDAARQRERALDALAAR